MVFKLDWEKAATKYQLSNQIIEKMLVISCPDKKVISFELLTGGCVNLNYKITFASKNNALLRVYRVDRGIEAAYREHRIALLLENVIPVPASYYIDKYENYNFAIFEYIEGITLRDLLLSGIKHDLYDITYQAGKIVSKIASYKFSKAGFFNKNLDVITPIDSNSYITFAKECLANKVVQDELTKNLINKIEVILEKYANFLPNAEEKNLVHGDFDPSNILVKEVDGRWQIAGIIDWEFAFSGSVLTDVANMLRYAYQVPSKYKQGFIDGLSQSGIYLMQDWEKRIHLINLISLLDCLTRASSHENPNQRNDICNLIDNILAQL